MELELVKPAASLNKAYRKTSLKRDQIELFKDNLKRLFDRINDQESEEHLKNIISDFFKDTWYKNSNEINTRGRADLVIHTGKSSADPVGVIFEVKRPANKSEMISAEKPNEKAFHELLNYYLEERFISDNKNIKHLIITNIHEWYIFDGADFERFFFENQKLTKQYKDWQDGRLGVKLNDWFYKEIAKPFIEKDLHSIKCTSFNLTNFETIIRNDDKKDDVKLIDLYKVLSPEHLLKQPFANDSNSLDKGFYTELLHIIGLVETKDGSKKLIERKEEGKRDPGSLIENAILQIDSRDMISRIVKPSRFGESHQERLFNVSLDLVITWINRILFLKLLEAQLIRYHKEDPSYAFLSIDKMKGFDALDSLFFRVLAKKVRERDHAVIKIFEKVPYLNSSLFEPTDLERETIFISNLQDDCPISYHPSTVIKNSTGKRLTGILNGLDYLFAFLDAYDFSGDGKEGIQEENKTLINASVLGLIFEKINGYKDGSFFTPGFITMYMCRETIRRAVVQKFNDLKGWNCQNLKEVYNKIEDLKEANEIINSLKLCDPGVGSGHFLVSSLNEIIAIKSELKILLDRDEKRLKEYNVEVANDELIITDEDGELFEYNPKNPESQRVQEALFHEKQTIIENCLFGVDINPNSVKICRLRLWIELLKNAYYTTGELVNPGTGEQIESPPHQITNSPVYLQTLPNIDINIKCGNSLISRYALDADIKQALKKSKWSIESYRLAVMTYRNATTKEQKREMESLISKIKTDFQTEIGRNDPRVKRIDKLANDLYHRFTGHFLFEPDNDYGNEKMKVKRKEEEQKIESEISKLTKEIDEIKGNKTYEDAFEWRFEFPEVLNDEGDFLGFDVVIGNPPYFSLSKHKEQTIHFGDLGYQTYSKGSDIYCLFYERGNQILRNGGFLTFITSNSWLKVIYGSLLKKYLLANMKPIILLNIEDIQVFEEATVESNIFTLQKGKGDHPFFACNLVSDYSMGSSLSQYFSHNCFKFKVPETSEWIIGNQAEGLLKRKIENDSVKLGDFKISINRGFLTGLNSAFIINQETKNRIISKDNKSADIIKPILRGRDISKYNYHFMEQWLICTFPSLKLEIDSYPVIKKYLIDFGVSRLEQSGNIHSRKKTNNKWFETQDSISYWKDFEKPKIIWGEISDKAKFAYDDGGFYAEATTFIMTGEKLKYLLAILNSKVSEWYFNQISTTTGMGTNRWKKYKIELLPIKRATTIQENSIEILVDQVLSAKKLDANTNTSSLEKEIDSLVYELYGLTEEEIIIVETANHKK